MMSKISPSVFLFHGDDEYRVTLRARRAVEEAASADGSDQALVETIDGSAQTVSEAARAVEKTVEALTTADLFCSRKVVWLRDANFLGHSPIGRAAETVEAVARLAQMIEIGLQPSHSLVISALPGKSAAEPSSDSGGEAPAAVDSKSAILKACKAAGVVEMFHLPKPWEREDQARALVSDALRKAGLQPEPGVEQMLVGMVGVDSRALMSEVEKLAVYIWPDTRVGREHVAAVACGTRDAFAWELSDAVGRRDAGEAIGILRLLLAGGEHPIVIVTMLANHLGRLAVFKELDRTGAMAGRAAAVRPEIKSMLDTVYGAAGKNNPLKMHPYKVKMMLQQARSFSDAELARARRLAADARWRMVDGKVKPELALELLVLRVCGARRARTDLSRARL